MSLGETMAYRQRHQGHELTLIHAGFTQPKALAETLGEGLAATATSSLKPIAASSIASIFRAATKSCCVTGFSVVATAITHPSNCSQI